jgi:hypothetical protein
MPADADTLGTILAERTGIPAVERVDLTGRVLGRSNPGARVESLHLGGGVDRSVDTRFGRATAGRQGERERQGHEDPLCASAARGFHGD